MHRNAPNHHPTADRTASNRDVPGASALSIACYYKALYLPKPSVFWSLECVEQACSCCITRLPARWPLAGQWQPAGTPGPLAAARRRVPACGGQLQLCSTAADPGPCARTRQTRVHRRSPSSPASHSCPSPSWWKARTCSCLSSSLSAGRIRWSMPWIASRKSSLR